MVHSFLGALYELRKEEKIPNVQNYGDMVTLCGCSAGSLALMKLLIRRKD